MSIASVARFASPAAGLTPLPPGPALELPAGILGVCNGGRVFVHDRWTVGVGVCPDLFLVLGSVSHRHMPPILKEQLVGYLTACGAQVLRLQIRFPLGWYLGTDLAHVISFWVFRWVETLSVSLEPSLGAMRPRYALAIGSLAERARSEWSWIGAIWRSLELEYPCALLTLDWLLWEISHRWELQWLLKLRDAERFDSISPEEQAQIQCCDRTWFALVRRYLEPHGYVPLPQSTARLL
jgi:hypothetical protein